VVVFIVCFGELLLSQRRQNCLMMLIIEWGSENGACLLPFPFPKYFFLHAVPKSLFPSLFASPKNQSQSLSLGEGKRMPLFPLPLPLHSSSWGSNLFNLKRITQFILCYIALFGKINKSLFWT
jgi:hypothetical protein